MGTREYAAAVCGDNCAKWTAAAGAVEYYYTNYVPESGCSVSSGYFPQAWMVTSINDGLDRWNNFTWTDQGVNYGPLNAETINWTWTTDINVNPALIVSFTPMDVATVGDSDYDRTTQSGSCTNAPGYPNQTCFGYMNGNYNDIYLNSNKHWQNNDGTIQWAPCTSDGDNNYHVVQTALMHELGHVYGLGHVSGTVPPNVDIMDSNYIGQHPSTFIDLNWHDPDAVLATQGWTGVYCYTQDDQ